MQHLYRAGQDSERNSLLRHRQVEQNRPKPVVCRVKLVRDLCCWLEPVQLLLGGVYQGVCVRPDKQTLCTEGVPLIKAKQEPVQFSASCSTEGLSVHPQTDGPATDTVCGLNELKYGTSVMQACF